MRKPKLVLIALACMIAMCIGLTACGGSSASSSAASSSAASSSAAASSEASSSAASSAAASSSAAARSEASSSAASSAATSSSAASSQAESNAIVFWKGTLSDGSTVCYIDDVVNSEAALLVAKSDFSDAALWVGPIGISSDGVLTITDDETKKTISFTITDITDTSFTIKLEGYGDVELKAVTEADIKAYAEQLAATAASEGEKFMKEIEEAGQALKQEVKSKLDSFSNELEKLSNEWDKLDEKTVLFWNGALVDGKDVIYMDDPASGEAFLSITKADLSDGDVWYGKCTASEDGKIVTITDNETGKTITYEVVESTPGSSMKMNVMGHGVVNLSSVTKGDFTKLADELAKAASEGEAK